MKQKTIVMALALTLGSDGFGAQRPYTIVGTGQTKCYDDHREIQPPPQARPAVLQPGRAVSRTETGYALSADGFAVHD